MTSMTLGSALWLGQLGHFAPIIEDIHLKLHGFSTWTTMKTFRNTNFKAHQLSK
jgi:hypothetical protein